VEGRPLGFDAQAIQRFLDGTGTAGPPGGEGRAVRLFFLDSLIDAPDRLARRLGEQGAAPLFAIGCPVVCRSALGPYVAALGPDLLVELLDCAPPGRAP